MQARLYRSRYDRMFAGVCGGLGHYLGIDPTIIRLLFVLLALANGAGVLIYILMMIVVPENPDEMPLELRVEGENDLGERIRAWSNEIGESGPGARNAIFIGGFLILLGILFLLRNFDIFPFRWFNLGTLWPLLIIAAGIAMLWRFYRGDR